MPAPLPVDYPALVVVVAERASAPVGRPNAVKAREVVIALDGIRDLPWRGRAHERRADAGEVFTVWRNVVVLPRRFDVVVLPRQFDVVVRPRRFDVVVQDRLAVRVLVLPTLPQVALEPPVVRCELLVELLDVRQAEHDEVLVRVSAPLLHRAEDVQLVLALVRSLQHRVAARLQVLRKVDHARELADGDDVEILHFLDELDHLRDLWLHQRVGLQPAPRLLVIRSATLPMCTHLSAHTHILQH